MRKRIVLKISGEALFAGGNDGFDDAVVNGICGDMIELVNRGAEVSFVVGGGNFWRGRDTKDGMSRAKSDQIGMLATLMNAVYLSEAFRAKGTEAVVMTPFPAHNFTELYELYRAEELLKRGAVVIFAGGTGLPFFSTDTITAVRASELKADVILFAKNVSGIYDKDPKIFADAKKYDIISYEEIIAQNLKAIDISAISICRENGIPGVVFNLDEKGGIVKAALGTDEELFSIGTRVY